MSPPRKQDVATDVGVAHPSRVDLVSFFLRSKALQTKRLLTDTVRPNRSLKDGTEEDFPFVIAESTSPLRTNVDSRERYLQFGKIQNLRLACQRIHHKVLAPGDIFSFWRQVGVPWRLRGFQQGREVREGCVIPTTGGGLCQMSGSLLHVALSAGCELIERHRHSALPTDVPYDPSRDATIFWNYVDLRFRSPNEILFECHLTNEALVVRVRAKSSRLPSSQIETEYTQRIPHRIGASCSTCFKTACARQCGPSKEAQSEFAKTAFLIDEPQVEFDTYVHNAIRATDQVLMSCSPGPDSPLERNHRRLVARASPLFRLRRAWKLRSTVLRGGTVARTHFDLAQILAKTYGEHVDYDVEHLCVAQPLLPHVWEAGLLGGRSFDVLMYRLPVKTLEKKLEQASTLYPYCRTLEEFRAPKWFADAEEQALNAARRIVTPHPQIAALFKNAFRVAWEVPSHDTRAGRDDRERDLIVFFGPTIGRKGAYAVREIVKEMGFELTLVGSELEGPDFWRGLPVRRIEPANLCWSRIHTVLQPALFEFWPRHLLRAQAAGSRLVISPCCGIEEDRRSGVYHVPFGDTASAVAILEKLLAGRGATLCV